MPQDLAAEVRQLLTCGAIVAVGAVPVGLAAAAVTRLGRRRLCPRWSVAAAPAFGRGLPTPAADVGYLLLTCFLFVANLVLVGVGSGVLSALGLFDTPPRPDATPDDPVNMLHAAAGSILASPVLLAVWLWLRRTWEGPRPLGGAELARQVALGVAAWVAVTPLVFAVNLLATWAAHQAGVSPEEHPFSRLTSGLTPGEKALFGVIVCVCTPLAEEVLFRGLFIGWVGGRWYRPWGLLALGAVFALSAGRGTEEKVGPLVFLAVLAAGLYGVQRGLSARPRFPTRTVVSVYATAALFAVAHSRVWPSPVPLFALGLMLGYLATRTHRIAASVVLHGLFNAVSFVYVLRGGAG